MQKLLKKWTVIMLSAAMLCGLLACGETPSKESETSLTASTETQKETESEATSEAPSEESKSADEE